MQQSTKIAASILSADFARLGEETREVLAAGADMIHFDVMDNHYVPNLTVGPLVCESLRKYGITAPIDVHLMTEPVDSLIVAFAKAGADYITFHPEASLHVDRSLQLIHDHGCKAGLAFNPATPLQHLTHILDKLDIILLMSVNPGFGGQDFIPSTIPKIQQLKQFLAENNKANIDVEIDGGVKSSNIGTIAHAGANILVVGSGIFHSQKPYSQIIAELRTQIL